MARAAPAIPIIGIKIIFRTIFKTADIPNSIGSSGFLFKIRMTYSMYWYIPKKMVLKAIRGITILPVTKSVVVNILSRGFASIESPKAEGIASIIKYFRDSLR